MMETHEIFDLLKDKKYRLTDSRKNLIEIFSNNPKEHFTIDDIKIKLEKIDKNINLASVYNNLNILIKEKIILQFNFNNKKVFEYNHSVHGHYICSVCEKTQNITVPGLDCLELLIHKKYDLNVDSYNIEFNGKCKECNDKSNK